VVAAASGIRALAERLREQGLRPESVTRVITTLNDLVTQQLIEVCGGVPLMQAVGACWIALGSQGRARDACYRSGQRDRLPDSDDPEAHRRALLPFARKVNEALDRSGFALCRGDIMAGNAAWCLSVSECVHGLPSGSTARSPSAAQRGHLLRFPPGLRQPDAGAGPAGVARRLCAGSRPVSAAARPQRARQPTSARPGARVVLASGGEHPHTLDLKVNGVQPFVEAARSMLSPAAPQSPTRSSGLRQRARPAVFPL